MTYFPHTPQEIKEMLNTIGLESIEDLFSEIPEEIRQKAKENFKIPASPSEIDLLEEIKNIARKNIGKDYISFLGGGAYKHYIPPFVKLVSLFPTFYTAYTPYQPEISQGVLQSIFEYQSLICDLTGMEVANASLYEAGSGIAEAALMSVRITGKKEVIASSGLNPEYISVLKTYLQAQNIELKIIPLDEKGETDVDFLEKNISPKTSGVIIQNPNFFGVIETKLKDIEELIHKNNALFILSIYPISLGILKPPSEYNVDIVVGEGQSLGIPLGFGGPYLGILATKKEFIRQIPGRIVGETIDLEGERGFVNTLQTREQHIRRAKATSNICTNEALSAISAAVYMAILGKKGIKKIAEVCFSRAHYLRERMQKEVNLEITYPNSHFFNEFVIKIPENSENFLKKLEEKKILGGIPLSRFYKDRDKEILVAVTERNSLEELEYYIKSLKEVLKKN
ncbi:aminomethyl-transferring glycine dehydrogenase subunit GcvPA [Dictyoglomus thermophilum]|uniref:Probable glycine dehydrogenase (decarboxylating) subunit 1 n=1 Tax=Dictyoglomus thermophilum (strain ATCC 35947 / DSM 3960 / H-6-12) TaxID=309799 RepID=GCSPA_DICT6|nr:aminomethyl-transferring glycine dehydrogenase subunit GcvPA [Dictyoglomus thermophilum]B5YFB8.1 RecName: Full=Probable glycine dehydrogenase (decarboxylating) subunit 1; AltName: Full=Glycine cleavage system P-protein subunit 1; AltName: Full=Glycine decarboxylase subunit 1; AltName: Full=Glycine dehydrogenase (aminomethyl-transferring) subunit 1 [Dictyoglomus thermophilum H-6-12]ACI19857.1 glycine cleavage system P-protein [Dictyoglomus thermophilum H-6-12]